MSEDMCQCDCGLPGCASRPGRPVRRAGVTAHGTEGCYKMGCRCELCTAASRVATRERAQEVYTQTKERATHHREPWTGPQLEIALREGLSAREAALMLGRTRWAVKHIRAKVAADPKYVDLIGLPRNK